MHAVNLVEFSPEITSSGQPSERDFAQMVEQGYTTVVNLALSNSSNALAGEDTLVTELGLAYVHIPIVWETPTPAQFQLFAAVMQQLRGQKVWVHCALNMRVSAFLYLYNRLYLGADSTEAGELLEKIWQPNPTWAAFIDLVMRQHAL